MHHRVYYVKLQALLYEIGFCAQAISAKGTIYEKVIKALFGHALRHGAKCTDDPYSPYPTLTHIDCMKLP